MEVCRNLDHWHTPGAVLTLGFFDGVHLGHQYLLERVKLEAARRGSPAVVFTMWPHPRIVLGQEPQTFRLINDLDYKLELFDRLGIDAAVVLDFTIEQSKLEPEGFLQQVLFDKIKPQAVFIGYDHRYGYRGRGDYALLVQFAKAHGFDAFRGEALCCEGKELSSTLVRSTIAAGDIALAERYLGRNFLFYGSVVPGKQLGRTIGFPTANIQPRSGWQLLPGHGVYSGYCVIGECRPEVRYKAVINVGSRPTVDSNGDISIEAYLLDFHGDLYGRQLGVAFSRKLRNELRFASLENLREQIERDVRMVREE